jgi:hypothetical protein
MEASNYKEDDYKKDYYNKLILYENDSEKDDKMIKDINFIQYDYTNPLIYQIGCKKNFTSISSILEFIVGFFPNNIILNSDNQIMIKYTGNKYLVVDFRTCSYESNHDLVGLLGESIYPYDSPVYKILNPKSRGLMVLNPRAGFINYNEFFNPIYKAITELVKLSSVHINNTLTNSTIFEIKNLCNDHFGINNIAPFQTINFKPELRNTIVEELKQLKSYYIKSNGNYVLNNPNPFSDTCANTIKYNRMKISVVSFLIDNI